MKVLENHKNIVLMFSGGKDSVALFYLMKEHLDKMTVLWVNTGDLFPENEEIVRKFQKQIPNFLEVKSDALNFIEANGLP